MGCRICAVQPIAPALAADFRALALVAPDGGAKATRYATFRIAGFGRATAPHHLGLIRCVFEVAMAHRRQNRPFDFGMSDLLDTRAAWALPAATTQTMPMWHPFQLCFCIARSAACT